MDRDKLRRKVEKQTVRDHTIMRHWADRRKRRYDKLMNEPVLPGFCTLCFICMVAGTAATVSFDLYAHFAYRTAITTAQMLCNAATSGFFTWLIFAVMVIPSAAIQLYRGFDDPYFERFRLTKRGRPRMPIRKRFTLYLASASIGLAVLFVCYLLTRIFLV